MMVLCIRVLGLYIISHMNFVCFSYYVNDDILMSVSWAKSENYEIHQDFDHDSTGNFW